MYLAAHAAAEHRHVRHVGGDVGHPARLQRDDLIVDLHPHGTNVGGIIWVGAPPGQEFRKAVGVGEHARGGEPLRGQLLPHHLIRVLGRPHPGGLAVVGAGNHVLVDPVDVLHGDAPAHGGQPVPLFRSRRREQMSLLEGRADVLVVLSHLPLCLPTGRICRRYPVHLYQTNCLGKADSSLTGNPLLLRCAAEKQKGAGSRWVET